MNIQRFNASNTRKALDKVRAEFGGEARILSTVRTETGVQVSAIKGADFVDDVTPVNDALVADEVNEITLGYLDRELKALREEIHSVLRDQLWQDVASKRPILSTLESRLMVLGLGASAIQQVMAQIDDSKSLNRAWSEALSVVGSCVRHIEMSFREKTATVVLGGTNGNRSTVLRQLMTDALSSNRSSTILCLSTSSDPSGALIEFCKSKRIKRVQVNSGADAKSYLRKFAGKKLIFVETNDLMPSLGQSDPIFDLFSHNDSSIDVIAVLTATEQSESLCKIISHIDHLPLKGTIISGVSEAVTLGAILDACVLTELPLFGVSNSNVPIIKRVTAGFVINLAKKLARKRLKKNEFDAEQLTYAQVK